MTTQLELSEKLAEIGAQLRQVRETKELTLDEVQASTLISKSHLQAIEEGNLDRLPELVYVQGFIRKYGKAIGMVEIATELPEVTTPSRTVNVTPELKPWHLYGFYVAIVLASLSALAFLFREPYLQSPIPDVSPQTPLKQEPAQVSGVTQPTTGVMPVNVVVEMLGESWMRVTVDGTLEFEGIMSEGKLTQWSGNREIILRTGNAAAVKVTFQQNPPQVLGDVGEVVEIVYDRDKATPVP